MASEAPEIPTYERDFGHCIISWKIKNFSLAVCNSGTEILTQEFTVSSLRVTRWFMGLRIESDSNILQVFLKRIVGKADESFRVTWKITILNGKGEGIFESQTRTYIHKDCEHHIDAVSPSDIIRALPAEEPDEVEIAFQMIVRMNTSANIPTPTDDDPKALIEDMTVICREGLHSDVTVMLNGKSMKVHRAVLCPRSKKLSHFAGNQSKKIQLYLSDDEAISNLFTYLYTGDLKYILDPPSISVYEYLRLFDIKELRDSYPQERVILETVIEATKFEFRWTIPEFTSSDEPRDSDIYEAEGMGSKWQLRIHPKGLTGGTEMQKKYIYIEALALSSEGSRDVYLNFIARDHKGLITVAKRTHGKITSGKKLGVLFVRIGGSAMAKSLVGDVLDIFFSVCTATGKTSSEVKETRPPVPFGLTNFDTHRILTNYMGILQSDNAYSDMTVVVQEQQFKAHKFQLAGRSITLSRMIEGMKNDNASLTLNNINKHVFRVFLDYLYTAVLTDVEITVLVRLYDVAIHFLVKPLQRLCLKHLANQLTPENSCYLLLFADERHATPLKTDALQYISAYRELVIDTVGWRSLEEKNPQLFFDVVYFLGNVPVEQS